ncbi:hypothetical protein TSAR_011719 [Trichomalopsis sarcophagae]|uniref:Uncharacterized protein n=1 Tax=Trichomalopsis sarcophagae TaxID=543379 RepID=A0A232FGP1_9HYME|nr:hypothetical protein TSAR_011719 [Trichomalopsis sarcophagae]
MVVAKPFEKQKVNSYETYYRATVHPTSTIKSPSDEYEYGDYGDRDQPFVYDNLLL